MASSLQPCLQKSDKHPQLPSASLACAIWLGAEQNTFVFYCDEFCCLFSIVELYRKASRAQY